MLVYLWFPWEARIHYFFLCDVLVRLYIKGSNRVKRKWVMHLVEPNETQIKVMCCEKNVTCVSCGP